MGNDYYDTVYKTRVNYRGASQKERIVNDGVRNFERFIATAATRETIEFNLQEIEVSIQTTSQDEFGQKYEKIILAPLDSNLDVGDIFQWQGNDWLFLTKVKLAIPTHIKGKIRECNHTLKWYDNDILFESPAHVITNRGVGITEGTSQGILTAEPSLVAVAIVPFNVETKTIKREKRFIIGNQAWRVTSIDDTSVTKLRIITLKEDIIDMAKDKPDDEIANVYIADEVTGIVIIDGVEYLIEGDPVIVWDQTNSYSARIDGVLVEGKEFIISSLELATFVSEPTDNPVQIVGNNHGLVGQFELIIEFTEAITVSKVIKVVSLWG